MKQDRRAIRTAYKQAPDEWVIYAARTAGRTWVGVTPNLRGAENRLSFSLRQGGCRVPGMQAAFDGTLAVEPLERLNPDLGPYARQDAANERRAHWCAELRAEPMDR